MKKYLIYFKQILNKEYTLKDIFFYVQGNIRYKMFYNSLFSWYIKDHIYEQIQFRIDVMDKECFYSGQCKLCGCETTALQMSNKQCNKPCYPKMYNKKNWVLFKNGTTFVDGSKQWNFNNLIKNK